VRFQYTVVVLLIAVVGTTTIPLTGQEEPLPVIQAKNTFGLEAPSIALAVEPFRDLPQPTLADAARANDYATFDALYRDAEQRGRSVSAFTALHELWTFSMTDPVGAFYGAATYARLARAYPGYARYIEEHRIVDRNGNVFYPTSETRQFLLARAIEGHAPRVQVAEREVRISQGTRKARSAQNTRSARKVRSGAPASSPAGSAVSRAPVPVPVPVPVPIQGDGAGRRQASRPEASVPVTVEAPVVDNHFGSRGIFLLLIGILGIGVLAMMMRAPREALPSLLAPPAAPPVEPIRRPSAVLPTTPPPAPTEKNRASGSHG
jgi:hypothetical protein